MGRGLLSDFTVTVEGALYRLRMDFNALISFEESTGQKAFDAIEAMAGGKVDPRQLRELVRAMLQRHHPDATPILAGDILSADMVGVMQGINAAMPRPEDVPDATVGNGAGRKVRTQKSA